MAEVIDEPLASHALAREGRVSIAPAAAAARFVLRCKAADTEKFAAFGAPIPTALGMVGEAGARAALMLGPDEWLLIAEDGAQAAIETAFAAQAGDAAYSLVDVSHRNAAMVLTGPAALDIVATQCPLDLAALSVGRCTRTVFTKCEVVLWRQADEALRMEFARSFAPYVWRLIELACAELQAA